MSDPVTAAATGAIISGGMNLLGGLFGSDKQAEQAFLDRQYGREMQQNQQEYNTVMWRMNRDWMTNMADQKYQRGVRDLKKAGLNPMLAYMSSSASQPSGSAPTSSAPSAGGRGGDQGVVMQRAIQAATQNALDAYKKSKENKLLDAQADKTKAEKDNIDKDTELKGETKLKTIEETGVLKIKKKIDKMNVPVKQKEKMKELIFAQKDLENIDQEYGRQRPVSVFNATGMVNQGVTRAARKVENIYDQMVDWAYRKTKSMMNYKSKSKYNNKKKR